MKVYLKQIKCRIAGLFIFMAGLVMVFWPIPEPLFKSDYATVLEASDGSLLSAQIASDEQWRFPMTDSIPDKFNSCILLYEDEYFYQHPGVNPISLVRAIRQNLEAGKIVSGGSTINMQVARMAHNNKPRTIFQKIIETWLAIRLEVNYTKDEILGLYVHHAPFGGNVVGLSAAAWRYYGRPAHQLSWAEAATLAILPNSPSDIFPGKNVNRFRRKRDRLLEKLNLRDLISDSELMMAKAESLPGKPIGMPNHGKHLMFRAAGEGHRGEVIRSTLDYRLQIRVEDRVNRYSSIMSENHIYNAAVLVIEVKTGQAKAYVGNVDNPGNHGQYVDIITSRRSTGSLLKPILYAAAMDEGLILPQQLLPDIPMFYKGFAPQNFDKKFHGAVPADIALSKSLNVPFVHLLKEYGYEKFHMKLNKMSVNVLDQAAGHYGLTMILGGAESSLWDITALYAGMIRSLSESYKPSEYRNTEIPHYRPNTYKYEKTSLKHIDKNNNSIIRPVATWHMLQAMKLLQRPDDQSGWERFYSSHNISWKTGTSYGFRDAWAVGMDANYVVGVWLGNADGEGRPGLTGIRAAAPLMFEIFGLLDSEASFPDAWEASMSEVTICKETGYKASEHCELSEKKLFPEYMLRNGKCPYHKIVHLDEKEEFQVNSSCYTTGKMVNKGWFVLPAVQSWYYRKYHPNYNEPPPFAIQCIPGKEQNPMKFIYPANFTRIYVPNELDGSTGSTIFEVAHRDTDAIIYWHLDNEYVGNTSNFHQIGLHPEKGEHSLTLVDQHGNEAVCRFEVISE